MVDKVIGINKDLEPPSSLVSLIDEHTICVASNSKFSLIGIDNALAVVAVEKEVSEPEGLVPVVARIFADNDVFGGSNVASAVFIVYIL